MELLQHGAVRQRPVDWQRRPHFGPQVACSPDESRPRRHDVALPSSFSRRTHQTYYGSGSRGQKAVWTITLKNPDASEELHRIWETFGDNRGNNGTKNRGLPQVKQSQHGWGGLWRRTANG